MKPSCKDCQDRHINCHSECSRYLRWKEHWSLLKAAEKAEKDKEVIFNQMRLRLRIIYNRKE